MEAPPPDALAAAGHVDRIGRDRDRVRSPARLQIVRDDDPPRRGQRVTRRSLSPGAEVRGEHAVRVRPWEPAGLDDGVLGEDPQVEARSPAGLGELALAASGVGARVSRHEDRRAARLDRERHRLVDHRPPADEQPAAESFERAIQVDEALEQEPVAVGRGLEERRIQHEERDDLGGRPARLGERGVIVDAQVTREQDKIRMGSTVRGLMSPSGPRTRATWRADP